MYKNCIFDCPCNWTKKGGTIAETYSLTELFCYASYINKYDDEFDEPDSLIHAIDEQLELILVPLISAKDYECVVCPDCGITLIHFIIFAVSKLNEEFGFYKQVADLPILHDTYEMIYKDVYDKIITLQNIPLILDCAISCQDTKFEKILNELKN